MIVELGLGTLVALGVLGLAQWARVAVAVRVLLGVLYLVWVLAMLFINPMGPIQWFP